MTSLLYLHGFASGPEGSKAGFCRQWAAARDIAFLAPDLNLPSFEALTVSAQVEAAEAQVKRLPVPPVVVGSSLGGFVAAALAQRGVRVRRLVLLAPAFGFARRRMASAQWAAYRERGEVEVFHYAQGRTLRLGPALQEDLPRWTDDASWRIGAATAILHGREDASVPLEESEAFAARNPAAVLHILEDDHALLKGETLALLARELEESFP